MHSKQLIRTVQTVSDAGQPFLLKYFIHEHCKFGLCFLSIEKYCTYAGEMFLQEEQAAYFGRMYKPHMMSITHKFADYTVTPVTLKDIVQDILYDEKTRRINVSYASVRHQKHRALANIKPS